MYDFHYDFVRAKYGRDARLLFTDTDSLTYCVQTRDIYEDMRADLSRFDTSDYPKEHKCFSLVNKKVLLKMKDESNGVPIRGFVGLRSKMNVFLTADEKAEATAKGIARSEIARLTWGQYKAALFGKKANPDACFSLLADRADNGLYLECQDAAQAKKWVDACTKLLATFRAQPHLL